MSRRLEGISQFTSAADGARTELRWISKRKLSVYNRQPKPMCMIFLGNRETGIVFQLATYGDFSLCWIAARRY